MDKDDCLHRLVRNTPFHLNEGCSFHLENRNKNCSCYEIDLLLYRNIINTVDRAIMALLQKYWYLNHYLIAGFLNDGDGLPKLYQKPDYTKNLRKLTRAGVLLRYVIRNDQTDSIVSALRCYHLSPGAKRYMGKLHKNPSFLPHNGLQVLEWLSINQFLLNMIQNYRTSLVGKKQSMKKFSFPYALVELKWMGPTFFGDCVFLIAISIRYGEGMEQQFKEKITELLSWLQQNQKLCLIMVLVEDMNMIPLLHRLASTLEMNREVYYIPDSFTASLPMFSNCFVCSKDHDIQNVQIII